MTRQTTVYRYFALFVLTLAITIVMWPSFSRTSVHTSAHHTISQSPSVTSVSHESGLVARCCVCGARILFWHLARLCSYFSFNFKQNIDLSKCFSVFNHLIRFTTSHLWIFNAGCELKCLIDQCTSARVWVQNFGVFL